VEGIGFIFGVIALVVAISASGRTRKLEKQLKEAGVLKKGTNRAEERGA
jgi:hypothetical protein